MIHAGLLVKTLVAPILHQRCAKLTGARVATTPLPPVAAAAGHRRVGADGTFVVGAALREARR
ncbi:hypothetical protein MOV08_37665 [Streptomyces yunnanensis]|uniref:Uncharacterized protein n=1 Tax=Streptomyces yunnanensis TaxID=156453 RepID=A0ABY8ALL4_9ACTN|nr:hypothetical protein [Streptomyces yunnanensis]WEB44462.1 hypothetical protein MOV08_37665 [Streptomyces yunnanensis]